MVDALTAEIEKTQGEKEATSARIADLQRQCDLLEAKLVALRLASDLRPLKTEPRTRAEGAGNRGRQPGSISRTWRRILVEATDEYPKGAVADEITAIAQKNGVAIRERDVNARCKKYQGQGITEAGSYGWRLRPEVLARFKAEDLDANDDNDNDDNDDSGDNDGEDEKVA